MKRFIDLRGQIFCDDDLPIEQQTPIFAFYDTCTDKFEEFSGCQDWDSWKDFQTDYDGDNLERYKGLCPEWVVKKKPKDYKCPTCLGAGRRRCDDLMCYCITDFHKCQSCQGTGKVRINES